MPLVLLLFCYRCCCAVFVAVDGVITVVNGAGCCYVVGVHVIAVVVFFVIYIVDDCAFDVVARVCVYFVVFVVYAICHVTDAVFVVVGSVVIIDIVMVLLPSLVLLLGLAYTMLVCVLLIIPMMLLLLAVLLFI